MNGVLRVNKKRVPSSSRATVLDPPVPIRVLDGKVIIDADGDWAFTDESGPPDGFLVIDADGDLAIDDAVFSGLTVALFAGPTILAY